MVVTKIAMPCRGERATIMMMCHVYCYCRGGAQHLSVANRAIDSGARILVEALFLTSSTSQCAIPMTRDAVGILRKRSTGPEEDDKRG